MIIALIAFFALFVLFLFVFCFDFFGGRGEGEGIVFYESMLKINTS